MEKVLVIGLGGTGRRVVEQAMALVESDTLLELDHAYGFLVFDDGAEQPDDVRVPLFPLSDGKTFEEAVKTVCRKEVLSRIAFPLEKRGERTFSGMGLRAFCDFSFLRALENGWLERLEKYIAEEMNLKRTDSVTVVLTGSLAGTAGSGLILQAAFWSRYFLEAMDLTVRIEGVWALADTVIAKGEAVHGRAWCEKKLAEEYAALREVWEISRSRAGLRTPPLAYEPWLSNAAPASGEPLVNDVVLFDDIDEPEQLARAICARTMSSFSQYCFHEQDPAQPLRVVAAGTKVLRYPAEAARAFCVGKATLNVIDEQWRVPTATVGAVPSAEDRDELLFDFAKRFVAFAEEGMNKSGAPLWDRVRRDVADDFTIFNQMYGNEATVRADTLVDDFRSWAGAFVKERIIPAQLRLLCDTDVAFNAGEATSQVEKIFEDISTFLEHANTGNYKLTRYLREFFFPKVTNGGVPKMLTIGERRVCPTAAVYLLCKTALLMQAQVDIEGRQQVFASLTNTATKEWLFDLAKTLDATSNEQTAQALAEIASGVYSQCVCYGLMVCSELACEQFAWECVQLALSLIQTGEEAYALMQVRLDAVAEPASTETVTYFALDREELTREFAAMTVAELPFDVLWNGLFTAAEVTFRESADEGQTARLIDELLAAMEPCVSKNEEEPCNIAKALYAACAKGGETNRAQYVRRRIDELAKETTTHLTITADAEESTFCAISILLLNDVMDFDETAADPRWMLMFSDNEIWVYKERGPVLFEQVAALANDGKAAAAYREQLKREEKTLGTICPMHLDYRWNKLLNE